MCKFLNFAQRGDSRTCCYLELIFQSSRVKVEVLKTISVDFLAKYLLTKLTRNIEIKGLDLHG